MPVKPKLPMEEKIGLVRRCLEGEISISEASRLGGVDRKSIEHWIDRYEAEGAEGFLPYERNRVYGPELKEAAVRAYLGGEGSLQEICKKYRIRSKKQLKHILLKQRVSCCMCPVPLITNGPAGNVATELWRMSV